jgi:hypothetical protein
MKRPDYRTLQALDAVIRERGFERLMQQRQQFLSLLGRARRHGTHQQRLTK